MSVLKQAFQLLDGFSSLKQDKQRKRIAQLNRLRLTAERKEHGALLAIRDIDQLRKERAYLLIVSGHFDEGIKTIESIVSGYESRIADLHDEAAFQLSQAALASFRRGRLQAGKGFARSALKHCAMAKHINKTVLSALELMQQQQVNEYRRKRTSHKAM